jgi:hypothetical protein
MSATGHSTATGAVSGTGERICRMAPGNVPGVRARLREALRGPGRDADGGGVDLAPGGETTAVRHGLPHLAPGPFAEGS